MKFWLYVFQDGYTCYTVSKMDKLSLSREIRKHGKLKLEY